ncbi:MAG TPA: hypothetical protein VFI28_08945 [Candidatus Limnocylindrales bacterium]|nr:hypothetical protein [Candidatus Limnocylindrales bacterium]
MTISGRPPGAASATDAGTPEAAVERLTTALIRALRCLGAAGEAVEASRIAADAWSAVRHDQPRAADRLNGVMHHLARLEAEAPTVQPAPARSSGDR